jgi:hypothetical protein
VGLLPYSAFLLNKDFMKVFVKQLQRWVEVTPDNKEILTKFGALKPIENDAQNNKGTDKPISGNTKRTRKPRKSA